jgi:hypothetical protein
MRLTSFTKSIGILSVSLLSSACTAPGMNLLASGSAQYPRPTMQTKQIGLNNTQQVLSGANMTSPLYQAPFLRAVGMSSVAIQPSKNLNQRRLLAIRAAKIDAYRVLAEQIHGVHLDGQTTVAEAILTSDVLSSAVRGTILGAETILIEATGGDTYKVEMTISQAHVDRLILVYKNSLL